MPDIHVHDPRLRRYARFHDLAVEVPDQTLSAMQDHFNHLRPNYGILFLAKFQQLDQGPASVGRLIAFWVLFRQQLLNDTFVSAVNAPLQLCNVVKYTNKQKTKTTANNQPVINTLNITDVNYLLYCISSTLHSYSKRRKM